MRRVLDQLLLGELEAFGLALARLGQRALRLVYAVVAPGVATDLGCLARGFRLLLGDVVLVSVNASSPDPCSLMSIPFVD